MAAFESTVQTAGKSRQTIDTIICYISVTWKICFFVSKHHQPISISCFGNDVGVSNYVMLFQRRSMRNSEPSSPNNLFQQKLSMNCCLRQDASVQIQFESNFKSCSNVVWIQFAKITFHAGSFFFPFSHFLWSIWTCPNNGFGLVVWNIAIVLVTPTVNHLHTLTAIFKLASVDL